MRADESRRSPSVISLLLVAVLILGTGACLRPFVFPTAIERSWATIRSQLDQRKSSTLALAEEHVARYPNDAMGMALAAEVAAGQYRHERAIELYRKLPQDGGWWQFLAEYGIAKRYEASGHLSLAESHHRAALALFPQHLDANARIGHILQSSGRVWEAGPHFFQLILLGKCTGDVLLGMSSTDRFFRRDERMEMEGLALNPPEPLMQLSVARRAIQANELEEAEQLLRQVVAARPDLGEAQGRLGRLLSDKGHDTAFEAWRRALPSSTKKHPEVLFSLGLQAIRQGKTSGAARCFLEALRLSPNHLASNVQLASALEKLKQAERAEKFAARGKALARLETALNLARADLSEEVLHSVVNADLELGRYWETIGWCYVMRWVDVPQDFPKRVYAQTLGLALKEVEANSSDQRPDLELRAEDFPWPDWTDASSGTDAIPSQIDQSGTWQLDDIANSSGIDFRYFEGTDEKNRLRHIFNTMGSGLAAIDYDRDGWPDLHLAQANDWMHPTPEPGMTDRLYRNNGLGQGVDVSRLAGVADPDFSHGITVGDYDQDGFPDLYINNKGMNRLYHNRGDGTFEDATIVTGTGGDTEDWSTSAVFADFNGDRAPDLYVLNYTLVTPTAEKHCLQSDDTESACTPDVLTPCADRFFLNQGDGTFRDTTRESGLTDPNGRGLGVIVWKYGTDNQLGLFIANDTTENYLFVNQGIGSNSVPQFQEEGVVRGVAFDVDGNAQASMGVAGGDGNGDGELDLFVTNFYNDSNTYYSRGSDGFFTDLTRPMNLRNASFKMLGFGAQFADINCDGWQDLITTNGHVDQQSSDGTMDRMPPQVFWNQSGQRFDEVPAAKLGPFFQGKYLGRGMALLDWNRDGRADVGIAHLHAPFALLSRQEPWTAADRVPLTIHLVGTRSCREPTGATVEVRVGETRSFSLQTGGSGFLVTNEPVHHFFVPPKTISAAVTVRWPNGERETWESVPVGNDVVVVEGSEFRVVRSLISADDRSPDVKSP